ncbi:hypothetical protein [Rhizobium rhizogenes]|uniref:hypothetical protein n=1 Tax=Rhizobium rhizogenes TaxID=359 RepID=UPI0022BBD6A7|nr:hypothetical protein [Rhizobium rhizogenes]MCZ7484138.1 hypothetical protein [Rhizobium rhizogenes]
MADPAQPHRLQPLIIDCFQQIVGELGSSGTVEGLLAVPLPIARSPEPDAMLLGHPDGNAIIMTVGLAEAIETYVQGVLMSPDFLSDYSPEPLTNGLSEERREFGTHLVLHMLDFVIHHEIAHDIRDHLGVLAGAF